MIPGGLAMAAVGLLLGSNQVAIPATPSPMQHVHEVVLDQSDGHLLIASHSGLYELSLQATQPTVSAIPGGRRDVTALASFGQTLYGSGRRAGEAGPSIGVATSADHGHTWTTRAMYGYRQLHNLLVTQVDGQLHMFAIDGRGTILRSIDGGIRWTSVPQVRAVAIQISAGLLFAATETGMRTSADEGATWTSPHGPSLRLLARGTPMQASLVGVDAAGTVWKYLASSWSRQGTTPADPQALTTVVDGRALTLIVATSRGLQRSTDWGRTWTQVTTW